MNKKGGIWDNIPKIIFVILAIGIGFLIVRSFMHGKDEFDRSADMSIKLDNDALPYIVQANSAGMCPCDDEEDPKYAKLVNGFIDKYGAKDVDGKVAYKISTYDLDSLETFFINSQNDNELSAKSLKDGNEFFENIQFDNDEKLISLCGKIKPDECKYSDIEKNIVVYVNKKVDLTCFTSTDECKKRYAKAYDEKHKDKK